MAAFALQGAGWTWTLYEGEGPLVLAHEIPDTPELRTTLECEPGSGLARLSLYGEQMPAGFARVTAGTASAASRTEPRNGGQTTLALRADHPVFAGFVAEGRLSMTVGDSVRTLEIERLHLPKLRRFAELCGA